MPYLSKIAIEEVKSKLTDDLSKLGKLFKAKKSEYIKLSVDHSLLDSYLKQGWEEDGKPLKTKTKIRKHKQHNKLFEDQVWCQFYELGYRYLNYDENLKLPYGKREFDKQQIDIVAIDAETVILIECKSSEKPQKSKTFKRDFEALPQKLRGFKKSIEAIFGESRKIKYVFATRNIRMEIENPDIQRLLNTNSFYYNDNTFKYINSLIKNYKDAAKYQFFGILFKNQLISNNKIELPALEGFMGNKKYYMFSIEPHLLLKMGFILHRTKANESEMPTYQRLLVPSRLKGISKFLNEGGYFPNSIIINFGNTKNKIQFQPNSKLDSSRSRSGILKIPNAYAIAYIIDGQHRVYGYAASDYKKNNTVPVVAFMNLTSIEQLEIFMDINQNQKAVSPSLRLTLEEDLYWNSDRADSRLKALKSSIVKELGSSPSSPLFNKITIGEDPSQLSFKPFYNALGKSKLVPSARGNKLNEENSNYSLYNVNQLNHNKAMLAARKSIISFLIKCYDFVEDNYVKIFESQQSLILSNRGTFAFIVSIGSINEFLTDNSEISFSTKPDIRFQAVKKYLKALLDSIAVLTGEEIDKYLTNLGSGADTKWTLYFQNLINIKYKDFEPKELIDWKERQDESLQERGRNLGVNIEKYIKKHVLKTIEQIYGEDWELEINSIKRECLKRAEEEKERYYKEGLGKKQVKWTEMFNINDYKTIITKHWTKKPAEEVENFKTFEAQFSIDIGDGLGSRSKSLKWISYFNSYRNLWAHEGTKEKRLNREEVDFLAEIHEFFY